MLVQLKRNWFAPNAVQYRPQDGLAEVPDDYKDQLPKDAKVMEMGGVPFTVSKPKLPGYGAKPLHELVLDEIPGGAPTHVITRAGEGQAPTSDKELEEEKKAMGEHIARAEKKAKMVEGLQLDLEEEPKGSGPKTAAPAPKPAAEKK